MDTTVQNHVKYIIPTTHNLTSGTIFLIWNVILSVLLAMLFFRQPNAFAVLPNLLNPVRGENGLIQHDIFLGILSTAFLLFIIMIFTKYIILWLIHKKTKQTETNNTTAEQEDNSTQQFIIEIPTSGLQIANGTSLSCSLSKLDN